MLWPNIQECFLSAMQSSNKLSALSQDDRNADDIESNVHHTMPRHAPYYNQVNVFRDVRRLQLLTILPGKKEKTSQE